MVQFNPAKINSVRFESIISEIETNLDDQHELEIIDLQLTAAEKLKGESPGYTLHVREKPNFFEWIFRILFHTPDTVRVTNVGQFILHFVQENQEVFYKLNENVTKNFIDKTAHHFSNYPEIEKTIEVGFGLIVHQQHMIQEYQINQKKLMNDNQMLNKAANKALDTLEEYEKAHGTLKQIKENIGNLLSQNEEYISLSNKYTELQKQTEETTLALKEIEAKKEEALNLKTKAEEEADITSKQVGQSRVELSKAQEELNTTKQQSESIKEETTKQVSQAIEWANEVEKEHKKLQTEARNTIKNDYMAQVHEQLKNELKHDLELEKESAKKIREEIIASAKREADEIRSKAEAEAKKMKEHAEIQVQELKRQVEDLQTKLNPKNPPPEIEDINFGW